MPEKGRPHALVAEDEALAAEAVAEVLEDAGYRVTVARDGLQALACIADQPPDLLVADLRMPGLDGASMIRNARTARAGLPVLIITGNPEMWNDTADPAERQRVAVLVKPVSPRMIVDAIDSLRT